VGIVFAVCDRSDCFFVECDESGHVVVISTPDCKAIVNVR